MVEYYDPERRQGPPDRPPPPTAVTSERRERKAGSAVAEIAVLVTAGVTLAVHAWWQLSMFGDGLSPIWAVQLLYPVINVAAVAAAVSLILRRVLHRHHEAHTERLAALHAELAALRAALDGAPGD